MGADLRTFLYNAYGEFLASFLCQLHDTARCRQARRAAAEEDLTRMEGELRDALSQASAARRSDETAPPARSPRS